jgi:outer membrane protein with beta-barrel domain
VRARALFNAAIVAAVLSIIAASPALAQVGVMGGLTLGSMSVSGDTEDQAFRLQPGYAAGLFFGVPLKKTTKIALQIEALWITKGVRISAAGFTESLRIAELEVPVLVTFLAKRGTGTNIRVLAGPTFAAKLSTGSVVNGQHVGEAALTDGDTGLKVGVQFERGKILYSASYTHGLSNFLAPDTSGSSVDAVKTRTMAVVVGWIFKKGR